jgi:hypothetical protein
VENETKAAYSEKISLDDGDAHNLGITYDSSWKCVNDTMFNIEWLFWEMHKAFCDMSCSVVVNAIDKG